MQAKFSKKLKLGKKKAKVNVDYVRWLLIERGFHDFPESIKKVLNGADVDSVSIMDDIKGDKTLEKIKSTLTDSEVQEKAKEFIDEIFESEPDQNESRYKRRGSRFSD